MIFNSVLSPRYLLTGAAALCLLLMAISSCRKTTPTPQVAAPAPPDVAAVPGPALAPPPEIAAGFKVNWSPGTGRGRVAQTMANGDRYGICFQCRYEGYAGGLYVGNMNGSGFLWLPVSPVFGFTRLNIFCAQDESLWDEETGTEYAPGWSENFGKGDDGRRLEYVKGAVLSDGKDGDVVLRSVNEADCYRVTRYLLWPRGGVYVLLAVYLQNMCGDVKRISFWTGDDPWIGLYKSSDGDVGWHRAGIVRMETAVKGEDFGWGGLYDLGNTALGQTAEGFSNVANFIFPDPGGPPPDRVYFANSFAHEDRDIDPVRPLDNKTLTALNLGWVNRKLAPGQEVRIAYALGKAETGNPGELPQVPVIPQKQWDFDRSLHQSPGPTGGTPPGREVSFRAETIRMEVTDDKLRVVGTYHLRNRTPASVATTLLYPFPVDDAHSYPHSIVVDGATKRPAENGVILALSFGPQEERTFEVEYEQSLAEPNATYILLSTQAWGEPLEHGLYEVSWPADFKDVRISYDGKRTTTHGRTTLSFERSNFLPDRDLTVSWSAH